MVNIVKEPINGKFAVMTDEKKFFRGKFAETYQDEYLGEMLFFDEYIDTDKGPKRIGKLRVNVTGVVKKSRRFDLPPGTVITGYSYHWNKKKKNLLNPNCTFSILQK